MSLPASWTTRRTDEIYNILGGGTPSTKVAKFWEGTIPWVTSADISEDNRLHSRKCVSAEGITKSAANMVPAGSIIVATRVSLGRVGITDTPTAYSQDCQGLVPRYGTFPSCEYATLALKVLTQSFHQNSRGTTIRGVTKNQLNELKIPLPPLHEQHRIVIKIEELFSDLGAGIASLRKAKAQLKTYRQSVLKWAFTSSDYKRKQYLLGELSEKIQIGPFGSQLHREDYIDNGIPLINPMHIQGGRIQSDSSYTISKTKRDSLPNYILNVGDVILGRRGEMGRCGLVGAKENGWFCGTGSLFIRPKRSMLLPEFLYQFLKSCVAIAYLEENAAGTTMTNLNLSIVVSIPIELPTPAEQFRIVSEIESRLSVADNLEKTIDASLAKADALRQSILKRAFEGKLVPQDPNDEPAEKLLERIKSEHVIGSGSPKRRNRATK